MSHEGELNLRINIFDKKKNETPKKKKNGF